MEYDPKADCLRIMFERWTDETYPAMSKDGIVMIDHDEIVGIVTPNYLRDLLAPFGIDLPTQHAERTSFAEESLKDGGWLSFA